MKTMNDIENKLIELWEMLHTIPNECKGTEKRARENMARWTEIRDAIKELIEKR